MVVGVDGQGPKIPNQTDDEDTELDTGFPNLDSTALFAPLSIINVPMMDAQRDTIVDTLHIQLLCDGLIHKVIIPVEMALMLVQMVASAAAEVGRYIHIRTRPCDEGASASFSRVSASIDRTHVVQIESSMPTAAKTPNRMTVPINHIVCPSCGYTHGATATMEITPTPPGRNDSGVVVDQGRMEEESSRAVEAVTRDEAGTADVTGSA